MTAAAPAVPRELSAERGLAISLTGTKAMIEIDQDQIGLLADLKRGDVVAAHSARHRASRSQGFRAAAASADIPDR